MKTNRVTLSRRSFLRAATLSTGLALAACAAPSAQTPGAAPKAEEPAIGETPVAEPAQPAAQPAQPAAERVFTMPMLAYLGDPGAGVDPGTSGSTASVMINQLTFSPLVYFDENLKAQPLAAESWETKDGQVWTFKLRKDIKWSDGTPVTAADYEASIKRNLAPDLAGVLYTLEFIKNATQYYSKEIDNPDEIGVKALDDYTLEFTLEKVTPYFDIVVTYPNYAAVPLKVIERYGNADWTKPENIVTCGPFKLVEWIPDQQMTFAPDPNYFGQKPGVDKFVIKMIKQEAAAMAAYETGELDFAEVAVGDIARVKADPTLGAEYSSKPNQLTQYLIIRSQTLEPLNDPRVRQAFAMAIDRDIVCNVALQGAYIPAYQFIVPGLPGYDENLGQELAFNPGKAKELLAEAGYGEGGKPMPTLYINSNQTDTYQTLFETIQAMWKENLGVEVTLELMEASARGEWAKRKPPMPHFWRQGWGNDYPDSASGMNFMKSTPKNDAIWTDNPDYAWVNAKFDELVDAAAIELDETKRAELYKQAQQILIVEDPKIIPLYYGANNIVVKPYVKGLIQNGLGTDFRFVSVEK